MAVNSFVFDEQFYLSQNPDVASAVSRGLFTSGQDHYQQFGRFEARDPNALFDTSFYLSQYPDVAAAGVNPFEHFQMFGAEEGRFFNGNVASIDADGDSIADEFDSAAYLAANPDVAAAVGPNATFQTAYEHYVKFGQFEGRTAQTTSGEALSGPFFTGGGAGGNTFTLTTDIDNVTGTASNDTIIGTVNDGGFFDQPTLQSGDSISGGAGTDTIRIVASNTAGEIVPFLNSVENIEVNAFDATALNLVNSTGVQKLTVANSTNNNVDVYNVSAMIGIALTQNDFTFVDVGYDATVTSGTDDVQDIAIDSSAGDVDVDGVETFNVSVTGAFEAAETNFVDLYGNGLETVNISGSGNLLADLQFSVTTIDASVATGNIEVFINGDEDVTATGGAGDDTFNFDDSLTEDDVVDGGEGFDTVSVEGGNYSLAADVAELNALSNVERIEFNDITGVTLNGNTFDNSDVTHLLLNTDNADTLNNVGAGLVFQIGQNNDGAAEFNLVGGSTTLNLEMLGSDPLVGQAEEGNPAFVDGITVNLAGSAPADAVATINLTSSGDLDVTGNLLTAQDFNVINGIDAVAGSTVNVDGAANLSITGFTNTVTVDASALTGSLIIQGSEFVGAEGGAGSPAVPGVDAGNGAGGAPDGDFDDPEDTAPVAAVSATETDDAQTGADTITLGSDQSYVVFDSGLDSGIVEFADNAGTIEATGDVLHDTITGFTAGADGDVLSFGVGPAATDNDYTAVTSATQASIDALAGAGATLKAAADIAASDASADWTAFSFQGDTYALYDATDDGDFDNADVLVGLTGVAVADLTDDNFAVA